MDHLMTNKKSPTVRRSVKHYECWGMEHIDLQKILLTPPELIGALKFQVFKYLYRFQSKGTPIKDLEKAQVYLKWLLGVVAEKKDPSDMSAEEIMKEIEGVGCIPPGTRVNYKDEKN